MDVNNGVTSIWDIIENKNTLTNWVTGVAIAGGFSVLVSTVTDKLTFAAILTAFVTACFLDGMGFLFLAAYGYATFTMMLLLAATCGGAGLILLLTLVGLIRKFVKEDVKKMVEARLGMKEDGSNA